MLICCVVGARPNFMKIAPVALELRRRGMRQILVHTGQHYDDNLSEVFFEDLGLPQPEVYLGVGSDTHARQTARIMMAFEEIGTRYSPDLIIVGGDVNSTLAVALVASKQQIALAHVEAGLRSFDRTMPEEINRIVTDQLSELLFTTEESAGENLRKEGISENRIHFVGNCMVDSLLAHAERAVGDSPWRCYDVSPGGYALLTLHRPSNVDDVETLRSIMNTMSRVGERIPVLFPAHPRTKERLELADMSLGPAIRILPPLPYRSFLGLMTKARFVMTDSGGIQEETTVLKVPCLTLRWNTERPITLTMGTNRLVGTDAKRILESVDAIREGKWPPGECPPLWDGQAAGRIVDVIEDWWAATSNERN